MAEELDPRLLGALRRVRARTSIIVPVDETGGISAVEGLGDLLPFIAVHPQRGRRIVYGDSVELP